MYAKHSEDGYKDVLDGIRQKTLVYGDKTLMVEFLLDKGAVLPLHAHPHEQTGYLVHGELRLSIGAESRVVLPGDSWCIAGNVQHCAEVVEDSVAIEVFSPVREEDLPLLNPSPPPPSP